MNTIEQDLEQQLRTHYQQEMGDPPSSSALWHNLAGRLPTQEQPATRWQRLLQAFSPAGSSVLYTPRPAPARGLVVAGSLVCALLLVFGIVYAAGSYWSGHTWIDGKPSVSDADALLLTQLLQDKSKTPQVIQQLSQSGQFADINLTKGNVTLQKVYADANYIIIGYTINNIPFNPKDPQPFMKLVSDGVTVTLPGGQTLQRGFNTGRGGHGSLTALAYIDASSVQGNPQQLNLHIAIPAGGKTTVSFDQTVPFHAGKTVKVNQTVTSEGQAITLDRVVITPSETRFYFTTNFENIPPDWKLSIAGKTYTSGAVFAAGKGGYLDEWNNVQNAKGIWTLKATSWTETGKNENTWQFTFTVS
ncbi:MAG TPA: DUF4179 domain-containing protein [Ktedonobacteraceae bacterium]|jgi:hypothetical protein